MIWRPQGLSLLLCLTAALCPAESVPLLNLVMPTDNDALFHGGGAEFYQSIRREYKGAISTPWEGGQYGFVRNPIETPAGLVFTRFHEGIDIRPMHRDARGEPTDEVRAIAGGVVVYVNQTAAFSNYGKYVVIEHRWDGSPYYSLYGHLRSIVVETGRAVRPGEHLGVMGYTGEGLNQARAHLHLELNLLLSRQFESWHDAVAKNDPNHHGMYNGVNLAGMDIARLYLALRERPSLTIPEFVAREETFYKVIVRHSRFFELLRRYPWLVADAATAEAPPSWEVSFTRSGLPLRVTPRADSVVEPALSFVRKGTVDYRYLTRGVVDGRGDDFHLTDAGKSLMRLLTFPE
jgi:murein DD-endopeptidase MepM/ murein hydrolase activator NlpD